MKLQGKLDLIGKGFTLIHIRALVLDQGYEQEISLILPSTSKLLKKIDRAAKKGDPRDTSIEIEFEEHPVMSLQRIFTVDSDSVKTLKMDGEDIIVDYEQVEKKRTKRQK